MNDKETFHIRRRALEAVMLKFDGKLCNETLCYRVEEVDGELAICDPYGTVVGEHGDELEIIYRSGKDIGVQTQDGLDRFLISNTVAKAMGVDVSNSKANAHKAETEVER